MEDHLLGKELLALVEAAKKFARTAVPVTAPYADRVARYEIALAELKLSAIDLAKKLDEAEP